MNYDLQYLLVSETKHMLFICEIPNLSV